MDVKKQFLIIFSYIVFFVYFTFLCISFPFLTSIPLENGGFKTISSKNDLYRITDTFYNPNDFGNFINECENINILSHFYNRLELSKKFDVLTSFNQSIRVTNFKGDRSFYYNPEDFLEEQKNEYSNIKSLQLNQKAYNFYNIKIDLGNEILWDKIDYKNNSIPVLLGYNYKKYYNLGDIIRGDYYSRNIDFEVIGFLEENCIIQYKNISHLNLDTYMVIPYPKNLWEVTDSFQFEALLYFAMINCDIVPSVDSSSISESIYEIGNETGFTNYSLIGIDNFQLKNIKLLIFVQKNKPFLICIMIAIFIIINILIIKVFLFKYKTEYRTLEITKKYYYINFFISNIIIPYGIIFSLSVFFSVLFLKEILYISIIIEVLILILFYFNLFIFLKK